MLIGPGAVRLLRVENAVSNFVLCRVVEVNIVRTNSQRSAGNENTQIHSSSWRITTKRSKHWLTHNCSFCWSSSDPSWYAFSTRSCSSFNAFQSTGSPATQILLRIFACSGEPLYNSAISGPLNSSMRPFMRTFVNEGISFGRLLSIKRDY